MRSIGVVVGMLAVAAAANADTVKGELTFTSSAAKVVECKSGRILTLGPMGTNSFLRLAERYRRLSYQGKTQVLVEVRGAVTSASTPEGALILESPNVVALNRGRCADTE
jgi:hypothetical protein